MNKNPIHIDSVRIEDYKCFDNIEIHFAKEDLSTHQWTVLLGENNMGKTSLLRALANLRPESIQQFDSSEDDVDFIPSYWFLTKSRRDTNKYFIVESQLIINQQIFFSWMYAPGLVSSCSKKDSDLTNFDIYAYGVSRYPSSKALSENQADSCESLFSTEVRLINFEDWLMQLDYAAKSDQPLATKRLDKIRELICGNLFPDILDFRFSSDLDLKNKVLFKTKDGEFPYYDLGFGYQSMLSWVIDFCKRMFERYPDLDNPLHGAAIVLVDEIDLHLHPKWQRMLLPLLSKTFPNTQFIVTTHSPMILQSIEEVNLYTMHRNGEKVSVKKCSQTNFSGWTVEEILSETMGLEQDIYSDTLNQYMNYFNEGLDENNKELVLKYFKKLDLILHPNNPLRKLLTIQKSQFD